MAAEGSETTSSTTPPLSLSELALTSSSATPMPSQTSDREASEGEGEVRFRLADMPDELLETIGGCLANPLAPSLVVKLSSTCKALRAALQRVLAPLQRQWRDVQLLARLFFVGSGMWGELPLWAARRGGEAAGGSEAAHEGGEARTECLDCRSRLDASHVATLALITLAGGLRQLGTLRLQLTRAGEVGFLPLCASFSRQLVPSLEHLSLAYNGLGPSSAEALAAALCRGALPSLARLDLSSNPIGDAGVSSLAAPLREHRTLKELLLEECEISDEGVWAFFEQIGDGDFPMLHCFSLNSNKITDDGMTTIIAAINRGMPALMEANMGNNLTSEAAILDVEEALASWHNVYRN